MNNCECLYSEIYNNKDMTKSPSPKKLTPFHIRTKDLKKDTATLFIRIHTRKVDVLVSTMLQVEVADWQKATASPRAWLAHQKKNYQLHAKLTQIEGIVKAHLAKVNFDREALDMDVRYISEPEKVDAERRAMEEAAEAERKAIAKREAAKEKARKKAEEKKRIEDEKNRLIWPFLVQFVDDIKSGARKIGSDDYAPGTCKAWKSFIGVYEGFDPLHKFGWADIDRAFVSRYINYLQKHGYMAKVVNKHLTNLKALINAAFIDGIHDNQRAAALIVKKKIEDRDKAVEIYLTEEELQALYEMPLTGKKEHIRDVFLIGCYTCQRVSDYNNLNADNFETTRKGTRIIRLVQQKTKTEVTIPILNENFITICEKYGYNIPKANEQVLNRYIKDILKDLSEQLPSLKEKVPTKLTMKQKEALRKEKKEPETDLNGNVIVPRYDCVTSHTARRTGITNMYPSHKYTILQMMHVSGHKNAKDLHGLHQAILRGDSRRNRSHVEERERYVVKMVKIRFVDFYVDFYAIWWFEKILLYLQTEINRNCAFCVR